MTFVGAFGIVLGMLAAFAAFVHPTRVRVVVFILAYLLHLGMSLFYYSLLRGGGFGDAWLYYADPMGWYPEEIGLSTHFVVYITQAVKSVIGGSYLDYFLLYQAVGFFGVALLMRTFEEIYEGLGTSQPPYAFLILLVPSIHYWSSAPGKDGLFFLGTILILWAMMHMRVRYRALAIGLLLQFCIRPHIAMITFAALAATSIRDQQIRLSLRVLLFLVSLVGVAFALAQIRATFQIDLVNADVLSDVLAGREAVLESEEAGRTAVVDASYPERVLGLLFRPFFFDASGAMALVVSLENAVLLLMVGILVYRARAVAALVKSVSYFRFALYSSVLILLLLAIGYYNVGLGVRQKTTMILPGLLVAFVTLSAVLRARSAQARGATVLQPVAGSNLAIAGSSIDGTQPR